MIKKLQKKFVTVAMCSVAIVLFLIMGVVNAANYVSMLNDADNLLSVIIENNGVFPRRDKPNNSLHLHTDDMSPEAPYETRFFTVILGESGNVVAVDTGFIAAIDTQTAIDYAKEIQLSGKTSGFKDDYKYSTTECAEGTMTVFLDCGRNLETFRSFLLTSVFVSALGLLAVFALALVFSRIAVKPIVESYEKQKRFITDASHELKTPLTIIDANAEVIEMENGESQWTQSIKNQVSRLASLTQSLISLSRMDEESPTLTLTDFSLTDAVAEAAEPFRTLAQTRGKSLDVSLEENTSYHGDEQALRQLVSLLLDNAVKYSNEGGSISLSLKKQSRRIELCVSNTVESVEKGDLSVMFERFYRADSSRSSDNGGCGICLSVAQAIVAAHKGKITAKSADGKSVAFTVVL